MSSTDKKEIGRVIEESTPFEFVFKTALDQPIALHDYVTVHITQTREDGTTNETVNALAEVVTLGVKNPLATERLVAPEESQTYSYKLLRAEILGYLDSQQRIIRPKTAANPNSPVHRADDTTLQAYFKGIEKDIPLKLGKLINRPNVIVPIHLQDMQYHLGVFAASLTYHEPVFIRRAGKTEKLRIGEFVDRYYADSSQQDFVPVDNVETLALDKAGKVKWHPVQYVYRHEVPGALVKIVLETKTEITTSDDHSIFVSEEGKMKTKRASEIRKGDRVVALKPVPKKPSKAYVGKVTTVKVLTTQTVLTQHSYVYDLSVPKLENFIAGAGGVVCHNTRAGKSYLAGRFIEEIVLNTPFPVLVIDVHADYVKMDQKMGSKEKHGDFDVVVYYADEKAPKVEGVTAKVETLSISPAQMTDDQIAELLGKTLGERQVIDLDNILSELRSKKKPFGLDDMIEVIDEKLAEIQEDKEKGKKGSGEGRSRLESLKDRLQHLTGQVSLPSTGMDLGQFFKPKTLNILCLSGLRANIQDAYTSIILDLLFQHITSTKTKTGKVMPLFIFVEEAHRVASNRGTSKYSVGTISTIIREGAKFGMYLTLISQRPRSIDPDILSNVGNYAVLRINNPQDQEMIEKASENISHRLVSDLPGLNQGEAVLVGPFVPLPAHVMVLTRRTVHHGVTPNLKALMDEMDKKQKRAEKGKF